MAATCPLPAHKFVYSSAILLHAGWPTSLLDKLDLSALLSKWPQQVLPLGAKVGGLTAAAAAHLGLKDGLLVAQGGADAFIGMIGLGVVKAGQMAMLTGECVVGCCGWKVITKCLRQAKSCV
eukprot:jgi/Chrzof1/4290/Cz14g07110.t1